MKTNYFVRFFSCILFFITVVWIFFCSSRTAKMNDFFGVQMDPEEASKFKIISYSPEKGASYHGTLRMESRLYAYAELFGQTLAIRVVNETEKPVATNYNSDNFILHTNDNQSYVLRKGKFTDYPAGSVIKPNASREYKLILPSNFWQTVGMRDPQTHDAKYHDEFWTGLNQMNFLKKNIQRIEVVLAGKTTLILKPILETVR